MEFGRVDTNSLTGIIDQDVDSEMVAAIVAIGNAAPIIVVREGWLDDMSDYAYRVVANQEVAVACRKAREIAPREREMCNCMIVEPAMLATVSKQF